MRAALVAGVLAVTFPAGAQAESFPAGCSGATGDAASLAAAITAANANGPGPDSVQLGQGCAYVLTEPDNNWYGPNALPAIASDVTIEGNGATIARLQAAVPFRFFYVGADPASAQTDGYVSPGAGALTLRNLTLSGGLARGGDSSGGGGGAGMGGAIFSQGSVLIENSTLTDNRVRGGSAVNAAVGDGGGGIGSDADSGFFGGAGGFGPGTFGGGSGGTTGSGLCAGGGAGFRSTGENGGAGSAGAGGAGGGLPTGTGGNGRGAGGGSAGDASGGGGCGDFSSGAAGGGFGIGGSGGARGGGGGGVGGGGGAGGFAGTQGGGGGGGFGAGGGAAQVTQGGAGGFGGGGGRGGAMGGGSGGFGGANAVGGSGGGGAGMGGAIFNMQGQLTVRNSTFAGNRAVGGTDTVPGSAQGFGGAVFNMSGSFTGTASTFAANTAAQGGASIYSLSYDGQVARNAQTTLRDSIVFGGIGPTDLASVETAQITPANQGDANAAVGEFDLIGSMQAVEMGTITGTPLTADPQLGPLQNNGGSTPTMAPSQASPVVDAGSAFGLTSDQRGLGRPFDFATVANAADGSDIGAVELHAGAVVPPAFGAKTLVTLRLAANRIPASGPLRVRVVNRNAFKVSGRLSGRTTRAVAVAKRRRIKLATKAFTVAAGSRKTVKLTLPRTLRRLLARRGRLSLRLSARVQDPAGNTRTVNKRVTPMRKQPRR